MRFTKKALIVATLLLATIATSGSSPVIAQQVLPNPVLVYTGDPEYFTNAGQNWIRYRYTVENFEAFPNAMFAQAPTLPPCGTNTKSSRTWVDFYDHRGKRLNGFCALGTSAGLNKIWFALAEDVIPPSYVYIELNDRQTNTKYKSQLAETTQ